MPKVPAVFFEEKESKVATLDTDSTEPSGNISGITVNQSLGIDPDVESLNLDEYDTIEETNGEHVFMLDGKLMRRV